MKQFIKDLFSVAMLSLATVSLTAQTVTLMGSKMLTATISASVLL